MPLRRWLVPLLLGAAGLAPTPVTPADSSPSAEVSRALREALAHVERVDQRVEILGRLAYDPQVDPALRKHAGELFRREAVSSAVALERLFPMAPPEWQAWILDLYRENWSALGRGVSTWRREMVRLGLESGDAAVRLAAARLGATRPIPRITHPMIDAAVEHPELQQAAILCLGVNRDPKGLRWALDVAARHG
ncbi:MAG: hypothetical protein Q9Q13_01130, partial [Acidobacteriota bacterium]|nr:hypothetical protein [Acidobacteriota bacterium]